MGKIVCTYPYTNAAGELLFEVVRFDPKDFRQRRVDPHNPNHHLWDLNGVERVLYRLPLLLGCPRDRWVFVVEGEKSAENLALLGITATTNVGGAGKWRPEYDQFFVERLVAVCADMDPENQDGRRVGIEHAIQVANALAVVAREVRIVFPPDVPAKGDLDDWLEAQGAQENKELRRRLHGLVMASQVVSRVVAPPSQKSLPVKEPVAEPEPVAEEPQAAGPESDAFGEGALREAEETAAEVAPAVALGVRQPPYGLVRLGWEATEALNRLAEAEQILLLWSRSISGEFNLRSEADGRREKFDAEVCGPINQLRGVVLAAELRFRNNQQSGGWPDV